MTGDRRMKRVTAVEVRLTAAEVIRQDEEVELCPAEEVPMRRDHGTFRPEGIH